MKEGLVKTDWGFLIVIAFLITSCGGSPSSPPGQPETPAAPKVVVEKEMIENEEPLPPEVKIRLKRDGKDSYSWELSGSDADEVLRVNDKLRKRLGGEKAP